VEAASERRRDQDRLVEVPHVRLRKVGIKYPFNAKPRASVTQPPPVRDGLV